MDAKSKFETMLRRAAAYYDEPAFRSNLGPFKRALFQTGAFPGAAAPNEISDQQVIDTLKGRVLNMTENDRAHLI